MKRDASDVTTQLLLALCRGGLDDTARSSITGLLAQPVDWDGLAELAALHGVVGLVRRNLVMLGERADIPDGAWEHIKDTANQIAFDGVLHVSQLAQVQRALQSGGIVPLVLKGVALGDLLYDDPTVRPSTDLDVLVKPEEIDGALDVLKSLGAQMPPQSEIDFQRRYSYDLSCLLPPVVGKATLVELHWHLAPRGLFDLDLDAWRGRAQPFDLDGTAALRYAPEEQLLHLALHMRKHRYVGLRWLADVAELLRRFEESLDWPYLVATARQAGLQTLLYTALSLAREYLDAPCPMEPLQALTPSAARRRLLQSVLTQDALMTPVEMEDAGWTQLAPAEVLLLDKPSAIARELRYRLFPPSETLSGALPGESSVGQRMSLYASRLAQRTATLLRRSS